MIVKNPDGTTRIIQQAVTQVARTATATSGSAASPSPSSAQPTATAAAAPSPTPHKVQIIRGPDGKVSVRGLNPGQQLVQMPDGKLHVLTTTTTSNVSTPGECLLHTFVIESASNPFLHFLFPPNPS